MMLLVSHQSQNLVTLDCQMNGTICPHYVRCYLSYATKESLFSALALICPYELVQTRFFCIAADSTLRYDGDRLGLLLYGQCLWHPLDLLLLL